MAKTLTEMAAEIVTAQAGVTRMSPEELSEALAKAYDSLKRIKGLEEGVGAEGPVPEGAVAMDPKASIQRNKIICLECGKEFKQLSRSHLKSHGLTPREYKKKYGLKAGQALTAKSLSAKRRRTAKERGLGAKLAAARKSRKKK
ncbi:MAG: MucR family transcriptional regulator [Deltaproteobacteria bacterium]|nr:MucR family transcriptional regulator [Deltaproteobacteria bacterium]MBW2123177.1 MucR family transcriptional regulator [Deltaproteobacteria bacterium]